jgi:hypothetical protein
VTRRRFSALDLGPLPVDLVSYILRRPLMVGIMHFSAANQDHAFERHGAEFLACLPHVAATIIAPDHIGQSPRHPNGFEMVRAVEQRGPHVLVAVSLDLDIAGRYPIQSVYPIGYETVRTRLRKRHLVCVSTWNGKSPAEMAGPFLEA